jgi:hypothetical protein
MAPIADSGPPLPAPTPPTATPAPPTYSELTGRAVSVKFVGAPIDEAALKAVLSSTPSDPEAALGPFADRIKRFEILSSVHAPRVDVTLPPGNRIKSAADFLAEVFREDQPAESTALIKGGDYVNTAKTFRGFEIIFKTKDACQVLLTHGLRRQGRPLKLALRTDGKTRPTVRARYMDIAALGGELPLLKVAQGLARLGVVVATAVPGSRTLIDGVSVDARVTRLYMAHVPRRVFTVNGGTVDQISVEGRRFTVFVSGQRRNDDQERSKPNGPISRHCLNLDPPPAEASDPPAAPEASPAVLEAAKTAPNGKKTGTTGKRSKRKKKTR